MKYFSTLQSLKFRPSASIWFNVEKQKYTIACRLNPPLIDAARDWLDSLTIWSAMHNSISEKCGCKTAFAAENNNLGAILEKIDLKTKFGQKLTYYT